MVTEEEFKAVKAKLGSLESRIIAIEDGRDEWLDLTSMKERIRHSETMLVTLQKDILALKKEMLNMREESLELHEKILENLVSEEEDKNQ